MLWKMFNYLGNMISYEKELDIDNKLHNYLKITDIINNVFRPQKKLKENNNKIVHYISPSSFVIRQWNLDYYSTRRQKNNRSRDEIYENNNRIHLDRPQNKHTNYNRIKSNTNSRKITGIQEEMDTTCKQKVS